MAERYNTVIRFAFVYVVIVLAFVGVIAKIVYIQTVEREPLLMLAKLNSDTLPEKAVRGNIFAADGRVLASSIPAYYVYMDTWADGLNKTIENKTKQKIGGKTKIDTVYYTYNGKRSTRFYAKVDSLAESLSRFFGDKSKEQYKDMLLTARQQKKRNLRIYPSRISYLQLQEIKKFPLFRYGQNGGGFKYTEQAQRVKLFGSLASATIGSVYGSEEVGGGASGLERYFDRQLTGKAGKKINRRVSDTILTETLEKARDGYSITSTIDIDVQDLAESALLNFLYDNNYAPRSAYAIVMEVKSGEVKAMVNMYRNADGRYAENQSGAVSDMTEPGSTFKTVSIMAALDDGLINMHDTIDTGNGTMEIPNAQTIHDHNWARGGFGKITIEQGIAGSSNIAMVKAITRAYSRKPENFSKKLKNMGIADSLTLTLPLAAAPRIPQLTKNDLPSLRSMAYGYAVLMPPIYTLNFYNAIANNGEMITPVFVKNIINEKGEIIKTFSTKSVRSRICSRDTREKIHNALLMVVEDTKYGTGKPAKSDFVRIAGKSGTARIFENGAYVSDRYQLSFCGYFPADKPQYSCIVVLRDISMSGGMAAMIFKRIAEGVTALRLQTTPAQFASDTAFLRPHLPLMPYIKNGTYAELKTVARKFDLTLAGSRAEWVTAKADSAQISTHEMKAFQNLVPNVVGMGARDAVFMLEKAGLRVRIEGRGRVTAQSVQAGVRVSHGAMVRVVLK